MAVRGTCVGEMVALCGSLRATQTILPEWSLSSPP